MNIRPGDKFTIGGVYRMVPSGRRWWQFWRPRLVPSRVYQEFTPSEIAAIDAVIAEADDFWANRAG